MTCIVHRESGARRLALQRAGWRLSVPAARKALGRRSLHEKWNCYSNTPSKVMVTFLERSVVLRVTTGPKNAERQLTTNVLVTAAPKS